MNQRLKQTKRTFLKVYYSFFSEKLGRMRTRVPMHLESIDSKTRCRASLQSDTHTAYQYFGYNCRPRFSSVQTTMWTYEIWRRDRNLLASASASASPRKLQDIFSSFQVVVLVHWYVGWYKKVNLLRKLIHTSGSGGGKGDTKKGWNLQII